MHSQFSNLRYLVKFTPWSNLLTFIPITRSSLQCWLMLICKSWKLKPEKIEKHYKTITSLPQSVFTGYNNKKLFSPDYLKTKQNKKTKNRNARIQPQPEKTYTSQSSEEMELGQSVEISQMWLQIHQGKLSNRICRIRCMTDRCL